MAALQSSNVQTKSNSWQQVPQIREFYKSLIPKGYDMLQKD